MINFQLPTEMNSAVLNWITPNPDDTIAFLARQSSPKNQKATIELTDIINTSDSTAEVALAKEELKKLTTSLIKFCADSGHWSVFEQACMSVTIRTTRAISAQILRHSLKPQEFSQRYASLDMVIDWVPELRVLNESGKKRDPSQSVDLSARTPSGVSIESYHSDFYDYVTEVYNLYEDMISDGIHPESARFILPLCTPTTLSVTGNLRDWIFYLKSRTSIHSQKEHQLVAQSVLEILEEQAPITCNSVGLSL